MKPKALVQFLIQMISAREQVLVAGSPGMGKTDMWRQSAAAAGIRLLVGHPAVEEPTDYKGFPFAVAGADRADFLPYGNLWEAMHASEPTLYLIDDLGQASDSVQKAIMQLLWGRRLNGHRIPDHVVFGAATNDINQKSGVTGILEPVKSRFTTIINAEDSVDDWVDWALDNGMPPLLAAFMMDPTSMMPDGRHALYSFEPTKAMTQSGTPRNWAHLGRMWNMGVRAPEAFWGAVGKGNATQFLAYADMAANLPSTTDIITNPDSAPVPDKPSHCYLVATSVGRSANGHNIDRIFRYLMRMEQPYRMLGMREARRTDSGRDSRSDDLVQTTATYVKWAATEYKELGLGARN